MKHLYLKNVLVVFTFLGVSPHMNLQNKTFTVKDFDKVISSLPIHF